MILLVVLLLGVFLEGCTPTAVKKVAPQRGKEDVVLVKRGELPFGREEKLFLKEEAGRLGIDVPEREEIGRFIKEYLRNRGWLELALRRASLYAPYIKRVLREEGLPEELALLPLVESGFNPFAVSRSGAAGLWQIIPSTAKRFGLRVDGTVDERFDLEKSTRAAARYLRELYRRFGNWELALAAYNCGEGCVERSTKGRDFWDAKWTLPEETRKYVPMFFAALLIARFPEKYGVSVRTENFSVDREVTEKTYRLTEFVRLAGLKESTFRDMNPHIKGDYIPAGVYVYLPKESVSKIRAVRKKEANLSAPKLIVRSDKGVELRVLRAKTKAVELDNGALLYIKE